MNRNPYFDNAKALLIIFVVLGHTISGVFEENRMITSIYMFIYLFHMPAFILVSGYFSKRVGSYKEILKLVKKLLIPYLIFQIIYTVYYTKFFGDNIDFSIMDPRWALWFLLSTFFWNIMLIIFGNRKIGILLSFVISLLIGYAGEINETLTLSRTFFFFPFFLMGYFLNEQHFEWIKNKRNVILSWILLVLLFLFVYKYGNIEWREWLYGRKPYEEIMDNSLDLGYLYRLLAYIIMGISTYLFLSIVPKRKLKITSIGSITLVIYLLHMFLIKFIQETILYKWITDNEYYLLLGIVPIVVIYLLTRKPIVLFTNKLLEFKFVKKEKVRSS